MGFLISARFASSMQNQSSSTRAQTTVEYMIILAIVLVIGLVVIGLAMFFSQSSGDVTQSETNAYWASQVRPLSIVDMQGYDYTATSPGRGEIALYLENVDSKPITIRGFATEPYSDVSESYPVCANHSADGTDSPCPDGTSLGTSGEGATQGISVKLAPNERKAFYLRPTSACSNSGAGEATADRFRKYLTIYYDTPNFPGLSFRGVKEISGKCNPA